jgi:mannose-1-phosphate guanylyltransferase
VNRKLRKAFVLGAGLGTRLRPLTHSLPKPLLPIFGKPLVTFAFDHLRTVGIREFIVNTHHLPEKFTAAFESGLYKGCDVQLVFEPIRLETGGGMKNIEDRIRDEPFIVYSGDILTDISIVSLLDEHCSKKNDVTIALRRTGFSTAVSWSPESGRVVDILGKLNSTQSGEYDFAGISIWNPSVFERLPANQSFSFIPTLIDWIRTGGKIGGVVFQSNHWINIGSRKEYLEVHREIGAGRWLPEFHSRGTASDLSLSPWPLKIESSCVADPGLVDSCSHVGAGCTLGPNVELTNSVLFPGSTIDAGTRLHSCIVAGVRVSSGDYAGIDFV